MTPVATTAWERRAARADSLAAEQTTTAELLRFYARLLRLQGEIATAAPAAAGAGPLRTQLDAARVARHVPAVCTLAESAAPKALRELAAQIRGRGEDYWLELVSHVMTQPGPPAGSEYFFARVSTQPIAEALARSAPRLENPRQGGCPWCDGWPLLAVFRPEGDGGRRSLVCSFCLSEWEFRRILCPWCGAEDEKTLPRYSSEELSVAHADACETCHKYVKTIDLTVNGLAEPLVDDVATVALDLWAAQQGYQRIAPNLFLG